VPEEQRGQVRQLVQQALAQAACPFHVTEEHHVYEIRPQVSWSKGQAVRWIKDKIGRPESLLFYVGDDQTDEDVFTAIPEGITIKVGGATPTAAHYSLKSHLGVLGLIVWLDAWLERESCQLRV
jgi:trehalose-phosphatase